MKLFSFSWLQPLQKRVEEEAGVQESSLQKAWNVVAPVLIYYVLTNCCVSIFAYMIQWFSMLEGKGTVIVEYLQYNSPIVSGIVYGVSMLIGAAGVSQYFRNEKPRIALPSSRKKDILILIVIGATAALCFNILFSLLQITASSQKYAKVAENQFSLPLWLGILFYGVASPLAEEIVFRGIVYNRLYRRYGVAVAVLGSSVLFGAYHGNMVQGLYGFFLGMLMAILYERYGAFAVPLILHSAANICIYVASYDASWLQALMNWPVCIISGMIAAALFLWVLYPGTKEKAAEE